MMEEKRVCFSFVFPREYKDGWIGGWVGGWMINLPGVTKAIHSVALR
jgi:hypothetical protein